MPRINFETSGSFTKMESFLAKISRGDLFRQLDRFGRMGVAALSHATPSDSGLAASSWDYEIKSTRSSASITWTNSDVENGFPVVVMLQYGYGTGTGGYVAGRDFINPALKPVFDKIAENVWKAVTSA